MISKADPQGIQAISDVRFASSVSLGGSIRAFSFLGTNIGSQCVLGAPVLGPVTVDVALSAPASRANGPSGLSFLSFSFRSRIPRYVHTFDRGPYLS